MVSTKKGANGMPERVEILVVGGGMAGMTMGCALAGTGIDVAVVDRVDPMKMTDAGFDGRTTSIAHSSAKVFEGIGLWPYLEGDAEAILDIRVADGHPGRGIGPLFLHYDHREIGGAPFGYIIENRTIRTGLFARAATLPNLRVIAPAMVERVERSLDDADVRLADGHRLKASLVVAADGRNSALRRAAGIDVAEFRYKQTAIVCTVHHERAHEGVAVELFLPGGPFAMLPMTDNRTNIVWTERADLAPDLLRLDEDEFLTQLRCRFGEWLGKIELVGPRFSYPLGLMHAERYTDLRLALVSEAAHAIHPISGQGFNLGLRDIAVLAEAIVDARRLELEAGDPTVLKRYERWRRFDNVTLAAVTDGLNRLFSNDVPPIRLARDLGLAAVGRMPPLKRFFMRHAMGIVGELPRLVRGEVL
jgi:2-octaprenyl-6-methoxyphenol hydroxylase